MGIIELVIMVAMVLFNGVFAGYEIALASVTVARLKPGRREPRRGQGRPVNEAEHGGQPGGRPGGGYAVGAIAAAIGGAGPPRASSLLARTLGLSPPWPASWPSPWW